MATLADVNTALAGLRSDFDTLVAEATVVYNAAKNSAATAADLDAVVATVNTDRAAVQNALATITPKA